MRFALLSDLHLEYANYGKDLPDADAIILAGDIGNANVDTYWRTESFLRRCVDKYGEKGIIRVEGNHEHYHGTWFPSEKSVDKVGDVVLISCTLWSGKDSKEAYSSMNDSRLITNWDWSNMLKEHNASVEFICEELEKHRDNKTIVVTHHAPTLQSVDIKYRVSSGINHGFYTDLEWIMKEYSPNVWVHGHSHSSVDTIVEGTRVICNPRGYVSFSGVENKKFDREFTFEL